MLARPDSVSFPFESLRERLDWVKCCSYTPDTHRLRYAGPQNVFLWGDMQLATVFNPVMERFGVKPNVNFFTEAALAETKVQLIQMKNISEKRAECFMPEDVLVFNNTLVKAKLGDATPIPLPIRGRVIECDLKTIHALDREFSNNDKTKRMLLTVVSPTMNKEYKAWVYTTRSHLLFSSGDKQDVFNDGVFLRRYPITHRGDNKLYGTWGGH